MAIDREAASDLGIPVGTVADTLSVLVGGQIVSRFKEGERAVRRLAAGRSRATDPRREPLTA